MLSKSIKTIIAVLVAILLLFIAFKYLRGDNIPAEILQTVGGGRVEVGRDIIVELNKINSVTLDDQIFRGESFLSFKDFTLEVVSETKGRSNPFAPFGSN